VSLRLPAVTVGQHTRVEGLATEVRAAGVGTVARAEDRFRVLSTDPVLEVPQEPAEELVGRAAQEAWQLGQVVSHHSSSQLILDVVVYDLDADPIVTVESVTAGIHTLTDELCRRQITALAMEPIGMAHGGISAAEMAGVLHVVCKRAPFGSTLLLCDPDADLLTEIMQTLEAILNCS